MSTKPSYPRPCALWVSHPSGSPPGTDFATEHRLQRGLGAIWHDFGVDFALFFQDTENNRLVARAASAFAPDMVRAEVGLVDLDGAAQRQIGFTIKRDSPPDFKVNGIDRTDRNSGQLGSVRGGKIKAEIADYLPEFCLADFRTFIEPVFVNYLSKLA